MRINKFLSDQGYCSRRKADELIAQGRIHINGKKAVLGDDVTGTDIITINGKRLTLNTAPHTYIVYHKPMGIECTVNPRIKNNLISTLHIKERVFPVGRLDKDTTGLLILTSDGSVVNALTHPKTNVTKEYLVTVNKDIEQSLIRGLKKGVEINASSFGEEPRYVKTMPSHVEQTSARTLIIIIAEGKNRQIKKMCEAFGYRVRALHRTRVGKIILGTLAVGKWRKMTPTELEYIQSFN